jgi:hypothetical protein
VGPIEGCVDLVRNIFIDRSLCLTKYKNIYVSVGESKTGGETERWEELRNEQHINIIVCYRTSW